MSAPARGDRIACLLLAAFALGLTGWVLASGTRITREDGFYYLQIARNVARGAGSSFDGLHTTNGYQPLWLLALLPVFRLAGAPGPALDVAIALQGALMAAGAVTLYRLARLRLGLPAALLAALLFLAQTWRESLGGLEFALNALLIAGAACVSLARCSGAGAARAADAAWLGVLLALASLARIDNLALAVLVWLALVRRDRHAGAGRLLACGLPVVGAVAVYVLANLWLCGHPLPVSAAVKRDWSRHLLGLDPHFQAGGYELAKLHHLLWPLRNLPQRHALALTLGGVVAPLLLAAVAARRRSREPVGETARSLLAWGPWILFGLVQLLAYGLLLHGELSFVTSPWAFAVQPLVAALLVAAAVQALLCAAARRAATPRAGRLLDALPLLAGLGVALWTADRVRRWSERDPLLVTYTAAAWARSHLPEDAIVGSWHAGALGYLSGRTVVNLDGLVNSWEFYEREQRDLCRYWQDNQVGFLVDMFEDTRAAVYAPARAAYAPCAHRLERVWLGPAPVPGSGWRIAAFRVQPPR